ncbi:hypothetical protein DL93DRAFT_280010 [Clavulina sp. PMI_390]|nr:hypothetical protein DL93DRAFT_280010 [Clavulina sp. PMI_390]
MIQVPSLQKLSMEGRWDVAELHVLLLFASDCRNITHLKIHNDEEYQPSASDVASLIRALPKLEYLDPKWQDTNIDGVLARRHGYGPSFDSIMPESTSPTVLGGNILFLPLGHSLGHSFLSRERLSACLASLFDSTDTHDTALYGLAESLDVGGLLARKLVVIVDVNTHTMVSMMGESWLSGGRVLCVEPLEFPDAWA